MTHVGCATAFSYPFNLHLFTGLGFTAGSSIVILLALGLLLDVVLMGKREKIPKIAVRLAVESHQSYSVQKD